jgi:hypothetical protein
MTIRAATAPSSPGGSRGILQAEIPLRPLLAIVGSLLALGAASFLWFPLFTAAWHWNTHRTAIVAGRRINLPFLWSSDDLWSPTLTRPGPTSLSLPSSICLDYHKLAPYYPAQSVRESWRATVHFKLHLDQVVKPKDASEAEALKKLAERFEKRVPYSFLPQWEYYESPIFDRGSRIWVDCISSDSLYTLHYWGRGSEIADVKRVAEQLQ